MDFAELVLPGLVAGLGATLFADIVAIGRQGWAATHGFYCLVGRWVGLLPRKGISHTDIRASTPVEHEAALGWSAHVFLGAIYGAAFALVFGTPALQAPQLWQGLSFGLATTLVPWFVFQPLFGWGIAMSKAPAPWKMRVKGLITHSVFGLGIWLTLKILGALLPSGWL